MVTVEMTKGIILRIDVEIYENAKFLDILRIVKELAMKHGGTVETLKMSQTQLILLVEIKGPQEEEKFLKAIKEFF